MVNFTQGMRFTLRQLGRAPILTGAALLTIALGIGANTAIFSVMNAVLLRTLPVPHPDQLVYFHLVNQPLSTSQTGYSDMSMSMPVYEALRNRHDVFQAVAGFAPLAFEGKVAVRIGSEPEEIKGEEVSGDFFSVLEVQPFMGRTFTPEDESAHAPIAVLNYVWWNARFAGDKDILGKVFYVKGQPFTIVGVAPPGFNGADPQYPLMDFWVPLQNRPELNAWGTPPTDHTLYGSANWLALDMFGRLQPGISIQQAQAQLEPAFVSALAAASPVDRRDRKPQLVLSSIRGVESLHDDYDKPLRFLMLMVGLVLLIACANIVMLLLARNSNRLPEFSLRRALGANRGALFAQLLQESAVVVAVGAALGWLFSGVATQALTNWSGLEFSTTPDRRVLLFTVGVSALVAIVFGLAPLSVITKLPLNLAVRSTGGTTAVGRNRLRGRKLVVALQISLCVVLLTGSGLLYRTLRNLRSSDLGMRTSGILLFGVTPQSIHTDEESLRFHNALLAQLRALPGVDSATVLLTRFGSGSSNNDGALVDGRNPLPPQPFAPMRVDAVGPNFLRTFGISLRLGRDFEQSDSATSPKVAIINQTFAEQYLPGTDPLGHHVAFFDDPKTQYTIIGVCGNIRYTEVREQPRPMAFFPFTQTIGVLQMDYALHTAHDPKLLIPEAAAILRDVDPNLPMEKPISQHDQFDQSISQERLVAHLALFFGGLAVFLVVIGLYGTISYAVSRRTMEIGVRMALGAQRKEVLRMILVESLSVAAIGLAIGIPAALCVAWTLRSMLFGLSAADPLTLVLALLVIALVTLAAAFVPARRAASIDPMLALRME